MRASIEQHDKETEQERDEAASRAGISKPSASDFSARSPMSSGTRSSRSCFALQRLKGGEPTEHQLRALEIIERQTRQQSFLIEDLLDLNRREIGKIELRRSLVDERMRAARGGDESGRG